MRTDIRSLQDIAPRQENVMTTHSWNKHSVGRFGLIPAASVYLKLKMI